MIDEPALNSDVGIKLGLDKLGEGTSVGEGNIHPFLDPAGPLRLTLAGAIACLSSSAEASSCTDRPCHPSETKKFSLSHGQSLSPNQSFVDNDFAVEQLAGE